MTILRPTKSLQAIPTNYIGTFSGLDGIQLRYRGSRWLVPSTLRSAATPVLRSGSVTEDGEDGRA
jgi:hypothetical protein